MKSKRKSKNLALLITCFFRELGDRLVASGQIRLPAVPVARLSRILDSSFSDPELIEDVVAKLSEIRAKLPGWPGPRMREDRLDDQTLASIREQGFEGTYRRRADKDRISHLYRRMLIDETLLLEAQEAIIGAEEMSPFWAARLYAPEVRLVDLGRAATMSAEAKDTTKRVIEYALRIEGDELIATFTGLNGNAGREAEYVLRRADDSALAGFLSDKPKPKRGLRAVDPNRWSAVYGQLDANDPHRGRAKVRRDGKLICRLGERPPDVELIESVLVVALLGSKRR